MAQETYLGDDVWASFDVSWGQIQLRVPHRGKPDAVILLEAEVWRALMQFAESVGFSETGRT